MKSQSKQGFQSNNMENIEETTKNLAKFRKYEALAKSDGGKELKKDCLVDIISSVDTLAVGYRTLNHIELIAVCARLNERLNMYNLLFNAEDNALGAEEALKEALKAGE